MKVQNLVSCAGTLSTCRDIDSSIKAESLSESDIALQKSELAYGDSPTANFVLEEANITSRCGVDTIPERLVVGRDPKMLCSAKPQKQRRMNICMVSLCCRHAWKSNTIIGELGPYGDALQLQGIRRTYNGCPCTWRCPSWFTKQRDGECQVVQLTSMAIPPGRLQHF